MAAENVEVAANLLEHADWSLCSTPPGDAGTPSELEALGARWHPAAVPGTAAAAMRDAGRSTSPLELDGMEWWWRCELRALEDAAQYRLQVDGIATIWEVWLNDELTLTGSSMYLHHDVDVVLPPGVSTLYIHCLSLTATLAERRPRPRWRSGVVSNQNLRWVRTSMLGRMVGWTLTPPPVGPWREITLRPTTATYVADRRLRAVCDESGQGGRIEVELALSGDWSLSDAYLEVRRRGDQARCEVRSSVQALTSTSAEVIASTPTTFAAFPRQSPPPENRLRLVAQLQQVERWWPHTHGPQPLYDVELVAGERRVSLGAVGFRTIEVERRNGAFQFQLNGIPIFARGAAWYPTDPVSFVDAATAVESTLDLARRAHLNMLRIPGGTVYQRDSFFDRCDELGILVWQDVMLAFVDPPEDDDFAEQILTELEQVLAPLARHPCLALVCGDQESDQHAAMFGLSPDERASSITGKVIPAIVSRLLPDTLYVPSSPTGGEPPFRTDVGIAHYYGIGAYLRPLEDAALSPVRFMSEGLAFAIPPESETILESYGRSVVVGHDPRWKAAIHHEAGKAFDLEDVRDYYARELFGIDPLLSRYLDAEYHLDLGRAVITEIFTRVLGSWRNAGSGCDGALLIALRDLTPGAGWGVVDALSRPKAPWYALRRIFAPITAVISDAGLNGLVLHLSNDTADQVNATLRIALFGQAPAALAEVEHVVALEPRSQHALDLGALFGGFRDLSYAYRFGPLGVDAIRVDMEVVGHSPIQNVYLPGGPRRDREYELGLRAIARQTVDGDWVLTLSTKRVAQYVCIDIPGFVAEDSWFHLPQATERSVHLFADGRRSTPSGSVRALNMYGAVDVEIAG